MCSKMNKKSRFSPSDIYHESFRDLHAFKEHHEVWKSKLGSTTLHLAAMKGSMSIIKYLLDEGKYETNLLTEDKKNILHLAVLQQNFELVHYLVTEVELDPLCRDMYG